MEIVNDEVFLTVLLVLSMVGVLLLHFTYYSTTEADPSGRAVQGMGLRPLACWDCGFEPRRGHGCLSCECCVLSGSALCVGLITLLEEFYQVWCV